MRRRPSASMVAVVGALGVVFVLALSCRYSPDFSNTQCGTSEPRCPTGYTCDDSAAPPVCVDLTRATTGGHGGMLAAGSGGAGGKVIGQGSGGAGGRVGAGGGAAMNGAAGQGGGAPGSGGAAANGSGGATIAGGATGTAGKMGGGGAGGTPGSGGVVGSGGVSGSGGILGAGGMMSGVAGAGGGSGGVGSGGVGTGGVGTGGTMVPACTATQTRCVNATDVQACSDGQWETTATTCPNACVGNACGGECRPQAKRCSTDTPQTCDQTGTWRDASTGACSPGLCSAGACLTTMNYGFSTGGAESLAPSNSLVAVQVQLPAGVLVGLGFITTQSAGQHLYLGLFTDVSGHAGKLIQSSAELTVATGTNEVTVTRTTVTAGTYWLLEVSDGTTHFASPGQSITIGLTSYTFDTLPMNIASPLPTTMGNAPDLYARVAN